MKYIPVFEYDELPEDIRERLREYYAGTDHKALLNNSYSRFPYLFDFDNSVRCRMTANYLENWFLSHLGGNFEVGYVLIHWDW